MFPRARLIGWKHQGFPTHRYTGGCLIMRTRGRPPCTDRSRKHIHSGRIAPTLLSVRLKSRLKDIRLSSRPGGNRCPAVRREWGSITHHLMGSGHVQFVGLEARIFSHHSSRAAIPTNCSFAVRMIEWVGGRASRTTAIQRETTARSSLVSVPQISLANLPQRLGECRLTLTYGVFGFRLRNCLRPSNPATRQIL